MNKVFITGANGQMGSYLCALLHDRDYDIYGLVRRKANPDFKNILSLIGKKNFNLVHGDIEDASLISGIIAEKQFDLIFNLCAMSFVHYSYNNPYQCMLTNYGGVINIAQAVRLHSPHSRLLQSSTSEMYGGINNKPNTEITRFVPKSPYAESKLAAYWHIVNLRDAYDIFACNSICHNNESSRRGIEFVTQKVIMAAANYSRFGKGVLEIGNMEAKRDWGHSIDYVRGMVLMLEHDKPDDYVLATGEAHSVRELIELAYGMAGVSIRWEGTGQNEVGRDDRNDKMVVAVKPEFYRPTEVNVLVGDPSKAEKVLGWKRQYNFVSLIEDMYRAAIDSQH